MDVKCQASFMLSMHCLISSLQSKKVELILPLLYKCRHSGTDKLRNLLKVTHLESDRVWNHSLRLHNTDFQKVKSVCGKIIPLPNHWKSLSYTENVQRISRFCLLVSTLCTPEYTFIALQEKPLQLEFSELQLCWRFRFTYESEVPGRFPVTSFHL